MKPPNPTFLSIFQQDGRRHALSLRALCSGHIYSHYRTNERSGLHRCGLFCGCFNPQNLVWAPFACGCCVLLPCFDFPAKPDASGQCTVANAAAHGCEPFAAVPNEVRFRSIPTICRWRVEGLPDQSRRCAGRHRQLVRYCQPMGDCQPRTVREH